MYDFLEIQDIPEDFFRNPEILLVKSLMSKAWQHVEPRHRYQVGVPLTSRQMQEVFGRYFVRVEVRERMLMLLPFNHILFKILNQDPLHLTPKELRKMMKTAKKQTKKNPNDLDSWRLWASTNAFLDEMIESEKVLRKALEYDPSFSDAWWMLGGLLYGFERFLDADKSIGQAVVLDPSNRLLKKYHGRVRIRLLAEMVREESSDSAGIEIE
ncbi:MAG: tetratricopeptide repeat protein [Candidatus Thorarchaeota archaeon]